MNKIALFVRESRKAAGLTQEEFAVRSGLGVTLENGCEACKKVAKKIVPSCYEDGCIEWLKEL